VLTIADKCAKHKISVETYYGRKRKGWDEEKALTTPINSVYIGRKPEDRIDTLALLKNEPIPIALPTLNKKIPRLNAYRLREVMRELFNKGLVNRQKVKQRWEYFLAPSEYDMYTQYLQLRWNKPKDN